MAQLLAAALLSCSLHPGLLIAAHRGGLDSAHAENTLPAFRHAAQVGAHYIELDLRATADGRVVVLHDARVDRTTDGAGFVHDLSLDAVRHFDAGHGVHIPTLIEVLDATRPLDTGLLLDLKPAPGLTLEAVAEAVTRHHDPSRVLFGVRTLGDRARLAAAVPGLRFLGFVPRPTSIDRFVRAGVEAIRLWPRWIERDPGLIRHVQAAGARVWVTAGDAPVTELARLATLGVDGVLTDRPADAAAAVGCR